LPPTGRLSSSASKAAAPGTGLADLGTREGIPFVLGHALDMKAIHGGNATHDTIDAPKIALVLRGGMLPQASVDPAARRATRDLLRRRRHLRHKRAELLAPIQQTHSQSNLPAIGTKLADKANRPGVAERFPEPAVHKSIAGALRLMDHDDQLRRDMALCLLKTAQPQDSHTRYLLRTSPGLGEILRVGLRYEIPDIQRCPRGQAFVSSCRFVKCARESAGKRDGPSGAKMGHAALKWAFSEAAVRFWRAHPTGQQDLARGANNHSQGEAFTLLAHKVARAVYDLLKRHTALDLATFRRG
jgi:transposase